jgi:hypothetical protein
MLCVLAIFYLKVARDFITASVFKRVANLGPTPRVLHSAPSTGFCLYTDPLMTPDGIFQYRYQGHGTYYADTLQTQSVNFLAI